jgi:Uncharacterised nucleotidyltransferase
MSRFFDSLSPEVEFLFICGQRRLDPDSYEEARAILAQGLDWNRLLRAAELQGLTGLVHCHASESFGNLIPSDVKQRLQHAFTENTKWNFLLTAELLKILGLCASSNIPLIPYKGPTLALYLYDNIALRQSLDLDIFLRRVDLPRLKSLLVGAGYESTARMNPAQEQAYIRSASEYPLYRADAQISLELQWDIVPPYFALSFDVDSLWEDADSLTVGGTTIRMLRPETLLLVLSIHGAKDMWHRIGWISDVAQLIQTHPDMDWDHVLMQARLIGAERILFLALTLARDLLRAPLPSFLAKKLDTDSSLPDLTARVIEAILDAVEGNTPGNRTLLMFYLRVRERWKDKTRYCARLCFSPLPGRSFGKFGLLAPLHILRRLCLIVGVASYRLFLHLRRRAGQVFS